MIKIVAGPNCFQGTLKTFERVGEDLVFYFTITSRLEASLTLPNVPDNMYQAILSVGPEKIRDATIDLNKGIVNVSSTVINVTQQT